jgi:hypothetical protein
LKTRDDYFSGYLEIPGYREAVTCSELKC